MANQELPNRRSVRIPDFDYGSAGAYFVTICAFKHKLLFGQVADGKVTLSPIGRIVRDTWFMLQDRWPFVTIDEYWTVMPNYMHGIVLINPISNSLDLKLGVIVARLKSDATKTVRKHLQDAKFDLWQRSYYDHVVRDDDDLARIRTYIENNPAKWTEDEYYGERNG